MSEREIDPSDADLPELRHRPRPSAGIVVTRHRAALIVVVGYSTMALCAWLFLAYLASIQGHDDSRDEQAAMFFAVVMAILCVKALVNIYRPVKPSR